jgi:hypothetical protein
MVPQIAMPCCVQQFENLAIELAIAPEKLALAGERLAKNWSTTPLFDIKLFTRHLESACAAMIGSCAPGTRRRTGRGCTVGLVPPGNPAW